MMLRGLLILALLLPSPVWAVFAERAGSKATSGSTAVDLNGGVFAQNVVAGNLLTVAGCIWNDPQTNSISVTGSLHTTGWTVSFITFGTHYLAYLAYRIATSSGAETVTINPDGSTAWIETAVNEYTAGATIEHDADGGSSTGTSTAPSDGVTNTTSTGLALGIMAPDFDSIGPSSVVITPNGSDTEWATIESTSNCEYSVVHRVLASAATHTIGAWTLGVSLPWGVYTRAFREAGGAAATVPGWYGRSAWR